MTKVWSRETVEDRERVLKMLSGDGYGGEANVRCPECGSTTPTSGRCSPASGPTPMGVVTRTLAPWPRAPRATGGTPW